MLPPEAIHKARRLNPSLSRGVFFLFVVSAVAWAVDPHTLISQYGHTAWGSITQTTDGYIRLPQKRRATFSKLSYASS